jgi:predicted Zn-dependent peptidase
MMRAAFALLVLAALLTAGFAQQHPDRSRPPANGPTPQLHLPPIQKRALSNGVPVWIVESHKVPLVQVNLVIMSGNADDPMGQFGLANLTAGMLDEGAGTRSALELADSIEFLGASLSTTSNFDASSIRLNVPVARLQDALPLMADVALRPTFPQKELDRLRDERLTAFVQARDDASSVASMAFARALFGAMHRYGTGATGTEAALKSFTPQNLKDFHDAVYRPGNGTFIVAGDISAATILPQLEKNFGSWRSRGAVSRATLPAVPPSESQIVIVDMPSAAQSQIRIGGIGVSRATPEYFPLIVLNTILGGSFTSRLNQNLREQHGYSYGVSSRFDMRRSAGPFIAGGGVQTDKTSEALREFFNELNGISKPIDAEELQKAKSYIALGYPSDFETLGDLSSRLEEMAIYNLPSDYFDRYIPNVLAVSVDAVMKAASTYLQPKKFVVVVAGDRKVIEPGIRALNLAPIRVLGVDEVVGK